MRAAGAYEKLGKTASRDRSTRRSRRTTPTSLAAPRCGHRRCGARSAYSADAGSAAASRDQAAADDDDAAGSLDALSADGTLAAGSSAPDGVFHPRPRVRPDDNTRRRGWARLSTRTPGDRLRWAKRFWSAAIRRHVALHHRHNSGSATADARGRRGADWEPLSVRLVSDGKTVLAIVGGKRPQSRRGLRQRRCFLCRSPMEKSRRSKPSSHGRAHSSHGFPPTADSSRTRSLSGSAPTDSVHHRRQRSDRAPCRQVGRYRA